MCKTLLSSILLLLIINTPSYAAVKGEVVSYKAGNTGLIGYLAYDDSIKGKRPGVIVVPDWWGHSKFARDRADALATMGYTAMVMDNYGGGKYVEDPEKPGEYMNKLTADPEAMKARFMATKSTLSRHNTVNGQIAALGYSLGGMIVIEMARQGVDVEGVASLWGVIGKPAQSAKPGNVKARLLIQQPAEDGWAPVEEVNRLKKEMKDAGADIKVIVYSGTKHGFTRPDADKRAAKDNLPIRYNADADKKSWNDLRRFLEVTFKN